MKTSGKVVAAAVAGLFLAGPSVAHAEKAAKAENVKCVGVNACKGKGGCKSADNDCKGKNGCKGKGFTEMTEKKCKAKGGTVMAEK